MLVATTTPKPNTKPAIAAGIAMGERANAIIERTNVNGRDPARET